ncbi:cation-transporting ATPase E [Neomicrococcus aestuarii]|uniref:Cation-transporting ATPase E n=1 Tax=Neomicrococcus aestuarii TaxID=556325 RepID=A0A7W8TTE1_9MICC|nr:HAD-IC family P-type ATPase [Neomicrococcus aestuarii]MBB5512531.1 cation-transporting ATPase E [Neomicrococcus aestuarii]
MARTTVTTPTRTFERPDDDHLVRFGLNADAVAERTAAGCTNQQPNTTSRTIWQIARAHLFTIFNLVLGSCAAVVIALGRWLDLLFVVSALANVVIGFVQEYSAKKELDKISLLRRDPAVVLRDGERVEIPLEQIVVDDVVVLRRGDQVTADGVVLHSDGLDADESLMTGESDPVVKTPGDRVLSGSSITSGNGLYRVTEAGADSHASRITNEARLFSQINSELRAGLNKVVKWISIGIAPIMAIVLNGQMVARGGWDAALSSGAWRDALISSVASIAAMIPQGLALMTTISFALAALKLAREGVLMQEMAAVEVLARVDVVCFDKTGTLTEGGVHFGSIEHARQYLNGTLEPDSALPSSGTDRDDAHVSSGTPVPFSAPASSSAPASAGDSLATGDDDELSPGAALALGWFGHDPDANPTAAALRPTYPHEPGHLPRGVVPFSSARRWSAVEFETGRAQGAWFLGAPEALLPFVPGSEDLVSRCSELAAAGNRTLVLCSAPALVRDAANGSPQAALPETISAVGILLFHEKVREDAASTIAYFREQDVDLKIISGDNPHTVAAAALKAGLEFDGTALDASKLPLDGPELEEAVNTHSVFGRVGPEQKQAMVKALQARGHVVAMTGDGINDALALKSADLGIAMGNAAPATKAVSRLVLLDGQFSRLPSVVAEGRKVIANIERLGYMFLTKTSYAIMFGIAFGMLFWSFPFIPRQSSTVDFIVLGGPAFVLALMPNKRRYIPGFLKRSLRAAIPNAFVITVAIVATSFVMREIYHASPSQIQTASFIVLGLMGLWVLNCASRPLNVIRFWLLVAMYALLVAVLVIPISQMYHLFTLPTPDQLLSALMIGVAGCVVLEILYRVLPKPLLD